MRKTLLTSILLLLSACVFAQAEEARYNYYDKTIVRNADGSTDFNVRFSLTVLTHTAMNSTYGQTYVTYNPNHQKIIINEAYTVQKNGRKVAMPERALTDVLPALAAKASDFNHLKEKIIMHTGLDLGSTIFLDYTVHSDAGFNKNLDFTDRFDATSPIVKFSYTVKVPEQSDLKLLMCSPEGNVTPRSDVVAGGQRVIKYVVENIPARSKDAYQVRNMTKQYNFFCTLSDFETELKEVLCSDIDPEIQKWADEYRKNEPDGKKRYDFIRSYVAEEFTSVPVPYAATYGLRPVSKIRQGAYITPIEQAYLLQQMLQACNIKADVRVSFDPSLPKEFRSLSSARAFYVAECFGKDEKLLNPSQVSGYATPAMQVGVDREIVKPDKGLDLNKEYNLEVKLSDFGPEPFFVLDLPANRAGVAGWAMSELPTKREVDFEVPQLVEECDIYNIKVSDGIEMRKPYSSEIADPTTGVAMSVASEVSDNGATVRIVRRMSISQKVFSVSQYAKVRDIITTWLDRNTSRILFVKK